METVLKKLKITKTILSLFVGLALLTTNAFASISDFYSRDWWKDKSGITTGTINDIQYTYLGNEGYAGTLDDRLRKWMIDATGADSSSTISELVYKCFVSTTSCTDYGSGMTFLGDRLTFLGDKLTFNP